MSSEKVGSPGLTYNHKLLYLYTLFMFIELLLIVVTYFKMRDGVKKIVISYIASVLRSCVLSKILWIVFPLFYSKYLH